MAPAGSFLTAGCSPPSAEEAAAPAARPLPAAPAAIAAGFPGRLRADRSCRCDGPAASTVICSSRPASSRFSCSRPAICSRAAASSRLSWVYLRCFCAVSPISGASAARATTIAVRSTGASVRGTASRSPRLGVHELLNVQIAGNRTPLQEPVARRPQISLVEHHVQPLGIFLVEGLGKRRHEPPAGGTAAQFGKVDD